MLHCWNLKQTIDQVSEDQDSFKFGGESHCGFVCLQNWKKNSISGKNTIERKKNSFKANWFWSVKNPKYFFMTTKPWTLNFTIGKIYQFGRYCYVSINFQFKSNRTKRVSHLICYLEKKVASIFKIFFFLALLFRL